jgi:biopolymer transport protein ExbD
MSVMKGKRKQPLGELNLASTADISFLLLIFFIVTTIFAEEQGLIMILPGKQKSQADVVRVAERNIATLKILANNSITLDHKPIELRGIKSAIEARIAANEKTVVVLETHPDAHYGLMVSVLDELKLANARKLTLKTAKK